MPGLGPKCCCTPLPPPWCCDLKSVDRWEIEAIDHTPSGCCELYEGTYYPDPALSSGCEYRRVVEYPDPTPCVDACSVFPFFGETYYLSVKRMEVRTVLDNGLGNTPPLDRIFTTIGIDFLVYKSVGYSSCTGSGVPQQLVFGAGRSASCDSFSFVFTPNRVNIGLPPILGFPTRVPTCGASITEKFFRLTTVLV